MTLQDASHPFVVSSRRCISHSTTGGFFKVLLAQMRHNPSSEGITKDVDHGPEPITGKGSGGCHLHIIAIKSLKLSVSYLRDSQNPVDGHN